MAKLYLRPQGAHSKVPPWSQPLYTLAFAVDGMLFGASDWVGAAGVMVGSFCPAMATILRDQVEVGTKKVSDL